MKHNNFELLTCFAVAGLFVVQLIVLSVCAAPQEKKKPQHFISYYKLITRKHSIPCGAR